jgi:hypothetical protein
VRKKSFDPDRTWPAMCDGQGEDILGKVFEGRLGATKRSCGMGHIVVTPRCVLPGNPGVSLHQPSDTQECEPSHTAD